MCKPCVHLTVHADFQQTVWLVHIFNTMQTFFSVWVVWRCCELTKRIRKENFGDIYITHTEPCPPGSSPTWWCKFYVPVPIYLKSMRGKNEADIFLSLCTSRKKENKVDSSGPSNPAGGATARASGLCHYYILQTSACTNVATLFLTFPQIVFRHYSWHFDFFLVLTFFSSLLALILFCKFLIATKNIFDRLNS